MGYRSYKLHHTPPRQRYNITRAICASGLVRRCNSSHDLLRHFVTFRALRSSSTYETVPFFARTFANISLTMSLLLRVAEAPVDYLTLRDELTILYICVRKTWKETVIFLLHAKFVPCGINKTEKNCKNIFILCKINLAVTDVPAATRATNMLNARNVLIFVVLVARAHLATDTFYSASSFCNARNEFTVTTRAVAKHLKGNARKFVSWLLSLWCEHRACDEYFEGCSQSLMKITKRVWGILI